MSFAITLGPKLRDVRETIGAPLSEVASLLGVSPSTLYRWETGSVIRMRPLYVKAWKEALVEVARSREKRRGEKGGEAWTRKTLSA
jgi:transcriptional regulator with XRE-family HTH domain